MDGVKNKCVTSRCSGPLGNVAEIVMNAVSFLCLLFLLQLSNGDRIGVSNCVYDTGASPCVDEKDNVIVFQDCNQPGSILQFSDIEILTYDAKGDPICCTTSYFLPPRGYVELPGQLKVRSGTITLDNTTLTNPNYLGLYRDYILITAAKLKNDILQTQYCLDGASTYPLVENGVCYQHFCDEVYTASICDALNNYGVAKLPEDLPPAFRDKFDTSEGIIVDSLFKGQYSLQFQFNHAHINKKYIIGCIEDTNVFVNIDN
uniref:Uncharacterized protein n=1 Tax=Plectus sambesii TaxID=2011161 RepID=A0A914VTB9_9BILA